jgi:hypothetical protein
MRILGFWHCYLINHWYSVIANQMRILLTSGLYDASEVINVGCIGNGEEKAWFDKCFVAQYPKLKIRYYSLRAEDYEFPTLRLIEQDNSEYAGYYFHAKGVTHPSETVFNHWRAWIDEAVLNRWQLHYENIKKGYDVSSVNFTASPDHFSGNYWWFNRRFIDRLPKIDQMDWKYRWGAEQYICKAQGNFFKGEKKEPGTDTFLMQYRHD